MGSDALVVDTESSSDDTLWPGRIVLVLAAAILFVGYAAAVLWAGAGAVDMGAAVH